MKKLHLLIFLLLGLLLTACGTPQEAGSWPGITVDENAGLAYVAYGQHVYAVQLENGLERWRFPADNGAFGSFAAPQLGANGQLLVSGYDHTLYSLDAGSGAQQWSFNSAQNRYIGSPLAADGLVFAPNADHKIYALDTSGNLQWVFLTGEPVWSQPEANGNVVYVAGMDHQLYALDARSGAELWSLDLGGTSVSGPVLSGDGLVYVGTLSQTVAAVNTQTGNLAWNYATQGWVWGRPTLAGDQLIVGDLEGIVYALDAASGRELWRSQTGGAITGSAALLGDNLYVINEAGELFAFGLDGRSRQLPLPGNYSGALYGSPVAAGDLLLIGLTQNDSLLIALDGTGSVVWSFAP
ncbi:MAG: PQQ-binding-like beta-propeller repeat protein [Anaerolineales bacterium]|nr:PQQ-binding-like beta-propeller repeat protein [Anaerolineales bacterium]